MFHNKNGSPFLKKTVYTRSTAKVQSRAVIVPEEILSLALIQAGQLMNSNIPLKHTSEAVSEEKLKPTASEEPATRD